MLEFVLYERMKANTSKHTILINLYNFVILFIYSIVFPLHIYGAVITHHLNVSFTI